MTRRAAALVELLARAVEVALVLMFLAYLVLIVSQIGLRLARIGTLYWSEEAVRFLLLWSVLLAASVATHRNLHVRVDLLELALGPRGQRWLAIVNAVILLAFALALLWAGWQFVARTGAMRSPVLGAPKALVYAVVAIGAALDVVFLSLRLWLLVLRPDGLAPGLAAGREVDSSL